MHYTLNTSNHLLVWKRLQLLLYSIVMLCCYSCDDASDSIVDETNPKKQFNVEELINELNVDTINLIEDVVLVEGSIQEINTLNNRNTIILQGRANGDISIICDMQKGQKQLLDSLTIGQDISIKGILKGTLKDVILLNCKISNLTH